MKHNKNKDYLFHKPKIFFINSYLRLIFIILISLILILKKEVIISYSLGFYGRIYEAKEIILSQIKSLENYLTSNKKFIEENIFLKERIRDLSQIEEDLHIARQENIALRKLLNIVEENPYSKQLHTKVISYISTRFNRFLLIKAGEKNGVKINQIVLSENRLIGRVIAVSKYYSKIMLINDPSSSIPIMGSNSHTRGILTGAMSQLKIYYAEDNFIINEKLITSGDGKIYPPNLDVAAISSINEKEIIANPLIDLKNLDFVSILLTEHPFLEELHKK